FSRDWSSDVCSSDLHHLVLEQRVERGSAESQLARPVIADADFLGLAGFRIEVRVAAKRTARQRAAAGGHAVGRYTLAQRGRLEAAGIAAAQGQARCERVVGIYPRRHVRAELIGMVEAHAGSDR